MPEIPPTLTVSEAADILGVDRQTVHRWVQSGRLQEAIRKPTVVLLYEEDVRRMAEALAVVRGASTPADLTAVTA